MVLTTNLAYGLLAKHRKLKKKVLVQTLGCILGMDKANTWIV